MSSYPNQPYPQQTPPVTKPRGNGFAITALVLGIVGIVLSFMPFFNNLTAAGAVVGLILGLIGVFRGASSVFAGIGTLLCGIAIGLTVYAQQQLGEETRQDRRRVAVQRTIQRGCPGRHSNNCGVHQR